MALTERLQIIVSADAKGAASEFQKIGATAERELGRTDDKLKRVSSTLVSAGTQVALAGGIATAGVFKLAQASSAYAEQASAASVLFGDAADDVEEFGRAAAESAGISARAAVQGSNSFAIFGKNAGLAGEDLAEFSTDLVQLAGDLASFRDTTPEEAIEAIGAALRGESEPISRYGVDVREAALQQIALERGIIDTIAPLTQQQRVLAVQAQLFATTSDAQDDFLRTSDSLANQQRRLAAEFENFQVAVGEGAVPIFSDLTGAAASLLEKFTDLSPEAQKAAGQLLGFGALGATAVGGLTLLAGGVLRVVDTLGNLRTRLSDTEGNLTRTGKAVTTFGKIAGGAAAVGSVLLLSDALIKAGTSAEELEQNVSNIRLSIREGNTTAVLNRLNAGGEDLKGILDVIGQPLSDNVIMSFDGLGGSVANIDRQINSLVSSGNLAEARAALSALADVRLLPENSDVLGDIDNIIARYTAEIDLATEAAGAGSEGWRDYRDAIFGYAAAADGGTAATEDLAEEQGNLADKTELVRDLFDAASGRVAAFSKALDNVTASDNLLSSAITLDRTFDDIRQTLGNLSPSEDISDIINGLANPAEDTVGVLEDLLDASDAFNESITTALEFGGAEAATAKADAIRQEFVRAAGAAGLTDEQVFELLETMNLLPEQIDIALQVSGAEVAREQLQLILDNAELLGLPVEIQAQVLLADIEGRPVDGFNLAKAFIEDMEDGAIDNPLIIAILGDDHELVAEADDAREDIAENPATMGIGGDAGGALLVAEIARRDIFTRPATLPIVAKVGVIQDQNGRTFGSVDALVNNLEQEARNRLPRQTPGLNNDGTPNYDGNPLTPRASGGPVFGGAGYTVNEQGAEMFFPSTNGFVMDASDSRRLVEGVDALLSGATSGPGYQFGDVNIYESDDASQTVEGLVRAVGRVRLMGATP